MVRAGPRPPAEGAPASVVAEDAGYRIDRRDLVGGVSFALEPGTLTAMVGPNGAGKSTMLGLLAGDLAPSAGSVRIAGRLPGQWRPRELALHRSVMLQQATSNFGFSVAESVGMGRLPHDADPGRDRAAVEAAVAESDLAALRDRDVTTLSGGEAARVAYARTSAQQAPVVLLDEPTAALDLKHQEGLLAAARERRDEGACVVVVLHDLNLAARYADRVLVFAAGRLVADGAPADVLTEERIEAVYGQRVHILRHPTSRAPVIVPAEEVPGPGTPVRPSGGETAAGR
ncbi:heme ABC transporter ATP-binding protein [Nocardiopsis composta]